jgi:para-aminobenzoate synthetase component 1
VDSCVLIRFIEKNEGRIFYRSGGGITVNSEMEKEYQELNDKIYVPVS